MAQAGFARGFQHEIHLGAVGRPAEIREPVPGAAEKRGLDREALRLSPTNVLIGSE